MDNGNIKTRWINHRSAEYLEVIELRRRILRLPLGLDFTTEQLEAEVNDFHLAAYKLNNLVGCLVLSPKSKDIVQMRQVAVEPECQGLGIGRILVKESELKAQKLGFKVIMLHARDTAVGFYEKLGYAIKGEPFMEVTLRHFEMEKLF